MSGQNRNLGPWERFFLKVIISLFFFVLLVQALMILPSVRSALSLVERLEGIPLR